MQGLYNVKDFDIREYISKPKVDGLFSHYINIIYKYIVELHKIKRATNDCDIAVVFQSWITKSPYFLPYINIPIIYICNEVPREFYDREIRIRQTLREKIINNILLKPIKILDYLQVKLSRNLKIITVSKKSAKKIYEVYKNKPIVIYPGVSLQYHNNQHELSKKKHQVICVGAINSIKNQKFLIDVLSRVDVDVRPRLVLIGNGYDKNYLREMINFARISKVDIEINIDISKRELISKVLTSKVFLYPSINEPFGLALIEAVVSGLPFIALKGGGYSEVVNELSGYYLSQNSVKWANTLQELLKNDDIRSKISKYNRSIRHKFTTYKSVDKFMSIIYKTI